MVFIEEFKTNMTYYNMQGVQYDGGQSIGQAFNFLKELEEKNKLNNL